MANKNTHKLSEKQLNILDNYYNLDLSLSEIAENEGITRQAVRDIIKKGENKLFELEEKLLFMEKTLEQERKQDEESEEFVIDVKRFSLIINYNF